MQINCNFICSIILENVDSFKSLNLLSANILVCSRWFQYINYHIENKCRNISLSCWFPCKRLYLSVNGKQMIQQGANITKMNRSGQKHILMYWDRYDMFITHRWQTKGNSVQWFNKTILFSKSCKTYNFRIKVRNVQMFYF
jgi:hypothetical protein